MTKRLSTRSVHAGENRAFKSLTTPIVQASTYYFENIEDVDAFIEGKRHHYEYGRYDNPTRRAAEEKLADLENAESCLLFDSGMAAVTTALLAFLESGDNMVMTDDVYRQTMNFAELILPRYGIGVSVVPVRNYDAMEKAISGDTRVIFNESPTNPYLNVMDLDKIRDLGHKHNVITMIDSTFATPYNQQPLTFGIDLAIHSATKYLGGHNDLLIGAVLGKEKHIARIREFQRVLGGVPDPFACYLLIRGLKTGAVRMKHLNESTEKIAEFLDGHPKIRKVYYPGLVHHQDHEVAKAQMKGYGGIVTIELDGGLEETMRFVSSLKMCLLAPSLGSPETLVTHPASMSFYTFTRDERIELGILDELVRIAVGLEDTEDIIEDLENALKKV